MGTGTILLISGVTALLSWGLNLLSTNVSNHVMMETMWELIGTIPALLYNAALSLSSKILDKSFFNYFNFFSESITNENSPEVFVAIHNNTSTLTTILDSVGWGVFAVCIAIMVANLFYAPISGDKSKHPLKVIIRIFIFALLLITWKKIANILLNSFSDVMSLFSSDVNDMLSSVGNATSIDSPELNIPFFMLPKKVAKFVNELFSEESIDYVLNAVVMVTVAVTLIQASLAYVERYITLIFYMYIGAPFIAIGTNDESFNITKDWVKGIFTQMLGLLLSTSTILMAFKFMFTRIPNEIPEDVATNTALFSMAMSVVFLTFSKNSEKYLNMVGLKTMPNGNLANSFMQGAGKLMSAMNKVKPLADMAGRNAGIMINGLGQVAMNMADAGTRDISNKAAKQQSIDKIKPLDNSNMNNLNEIGKDFNALNDSGHNLDIAKADYDKAKNSLSGHNATEERKIANASGIDEQERNSKISELAKQRDDSLKNNEKKLDNEKRDINNNLSLSKKQKEQKLDDAQQRYKDANAETRKQYKDGVKKANQEYIDKKKSAYESATKAYKANQKSISNKIENGKGNVRSKDLFKDGTEMPVRYGTDGHGNQYAVAQVINKVGFGSGARKEYKQVAVPLNNAPALAQGSVLVDVNGAQIASSNGQIVNTDYSEVRLMGSNPISKRVNLDEIKFEEDDEDGGIDPTEKPIDVQTANDDDDYENIDDSEKED